MSVSPLLFHSTAHTEEVKKYVETVHKVLTFFLVPELLEKFKCTFYFIR